MTVPVDAIRLKLSSEMRDGIDAWNCAPERGSLFYAIRENARGRAEMHGATMQGSCARHRSRAELVGMFLEEARLAAGIRHPNVVPTLDVEGRSVVESLDEVEARLKDPSKGKLYLFDNNTKDRWEKGHVPTAKWVAFNDVKASDLPAEKDATLVFYCANERCSACHKAAAAAVALGHTNVSIMPAGIKGWEDAGRPVERS